MAYEEKIQKVNNYHQKIMSRFQNSMKTTSDDGVYNIKKIMFISHFVMKIFAFEVRGGY